MILQKLGSKPEECVFIDDQAKNLLPAKELGMATIEFKNPEQLEEDLADHGINV